ncbi:MAG: hypothetical protein RIA64_08970 [Rhodospirillales bacterium]
MEQLNDFILDFSAFAKRSDGNVTPFSLRATCPDYDEDRGYFCRVFCPYFRKKPFLIFGVDEAQACELSIEFMRQMLEDQVELVDAEGRPIALPKIDFPLIQDDFK